MKRPCCKESGHITNFMEDDFEDILMGAAATCRNIVSSEVEKAGLTLFTFDPVSALSVRIAADGQDKHCGHECLAGG